MSTFAPFFDDLNAMDCDFEHQPLSPLDQISMMVELAHQCISLRKAYVSISLFGGSDAITVYIASGDDVTTTEYLALGEWLLTPKDAYWATATPMLGRVKDQPSLQAIIDALNEVLA